MDDSFKDKYFRKLKYKSKYINLEYEESLEIYLKAKTEFMQSASEYAYKNEKENPFFKNNQPESEKRTSVNKDGKKIYREIVNKTEINEVTKPLPVPGGYLILIIKL